MGEKRQMEARRQDGVRKRPFQLVTKKEGAAIFKVSTRMFDKMRKEDDDFPGCIVLGGSALRWVEGELEAYARERQLPCGKVA